MTALRRRLIPYSLLGPGVLWLILFFVVPMYFMGRLALESGSFPSYTFDWNFSNFSDVLSTYDTQFVRAFKYSAVATLLALLIAYPLAYAIAFRGGKWKNALLFLVIVPFFVTYLIRTLSWETILADDGIVVKTLQSLHLIGQNSHVLATTGAVIAGLTYNFLPFMILPLYASLERIDGRMLEAGYDLYGTRRAVFTRVTLPLSAPGIVAGGLLTFIPAAGDFINAELLGTPRQAMIGNVIQSRYLELTDYPTAAALSFVLMATILILVFVWARIMGTESLMGSEAR